MVGHKDVLELLTDVKKTQQSHGELLGRIDERTKALECSTREQQTDINDLYGRYNDQERTISKWRGITIGAVGVLGLMGTVLGIVVFFF